MNVDVLTMAELYDKIRRTVTNKYELQVLESFLIFNKCVMLVCICENSLTDRYASRNVLKTNFYQPTKVALSFRLAPDFLPDVVCPKKPYECSSSSGRGLVAGTRACQMFTAAQVASSVDSTFASRTSRVAVSVSSCLRTGSGYPFVPSIARMLTCLRRNYSINQRSL